LQVISLDSFNLFSTLYTLTSLLHILPAKQQIKILDLNRILAEAEPVVAKAGLYIQEMASKKKHLKIEEKFKNNLVSEVDRNAEQILVTGLKPIIKEAGFLTEEETVSQGEEHLKWVIDPLDGTTNFLRGVPAYCVSVALMEGNSVLIGLVYDCVLNHFYTAVKGQGAFQNGQQLQVNNNSFKQSLFATGFPYYDFSKAQPYLKVFEHLMHHTLGMRRLGSAALDLCHVANGIYDGYFEYSLHPYDVAAGALIVQEAGGTVTDFSGGDGYIFNSEIVAASPKVFKKLSQLLLDNF